MHAVELIDRRDREREKALEDLKARLAALEVHTGAPAHVPAPPVVIVIDDDE